MIDEEESVSEPKRSRRRPATTPDAREKQLVAAAFDLAEKRIHNGTASAQEIVHFLRLGSSREELEQDRIRNENALTQAKVEAMESAARIEVLYEQALDAMRSYAGQINKSRDADED